jgi:hypothetical protein
MPDTERGDLPWIFCIQALLFGPFRLGPWPYTSIWDLGSITCFSQALVYAATHWVLATNYSRAAVITNFLLGGVRRLRRIYPELSVLDGETRSLIFGAGPAAEIIAHTRRIHPGIGSKT